MRKIILLLLILLSVGSLGGFLFLNKEIINGNLKITDGQKQLEEGEALLAQGKNKLASGKRRLSNAENIYNRTKLVPTVLLGATPVVGALAIIGDKIADKRLAAGRQLAARGNEKVRAGETQLAEGQSEYDRGLKRLQQAKTIRIVFAVSAILFAVLFIVAMFYWFIRKRIPPA
jgi:hypothetical protein